MARDFNIVVFSKDRGCQLDLLLRSYERFFRYDGMIHVLRTWSSIEYRDGYDRVDMHHRNKEINWIDENFPTPQYGRGFRAWVRQLVDPGKPYTMFLVDDNVFKEPFDPDDSPELDVLDWRTDIASLSLRMHPGIVWCYTERRPNPPPAFGDPPLIWEWRKAIADWKYPMSCDGHIFRTADIFPMVHSLSYANPNTLEGAMAANPLPHPNMMCLPKAPVMNLPVNKVQTVNGNYCGNISAKYLNDQYLSGKRLDLEPLVGFENTSAHQEVSLTFME